MLAVPAMAWAADPQIAEFSDNPDPVAAGGAYAYTLRIDNNAVDVASNVRLRVTLPSGASFVSATPASQNCVATSATQIDCNLGALGANGADVRNILMTWRTTVPGPTTLTATATLSSDNDSNSANNTQTQTTTIISGANLGLTKTGSPNPVVGGGNVTYTLTASNAGPNASNAITLIDTLSPSSTFVSASGSGWSCSHASGTVTCTRPGPHAVGAAIPPVSVVATVNVGSGTVTNTATLEPSAGGTADPDSSNNTATANTTVDPGADVRIDSKTVSSGSPAASGASVSFLIQPRNGGPSQANNAVVTDTLPAGWTFVSASGTNWSCSASGQTVSCTRATLPVGAIDNITIVATAPSTATSTNYTNTATIASATADPVSTNNSGSVTVNVRPDGADLSLIKTKTPNPVNVGSNMTSTITVRNNGPRTATGPVRVIERLGAETFVSFSGTGWSCTPNGQDIVCEHANAAGLALTALPALTIVTTATGTGTMSNTACTGNSVPSGSSATALPPVQGDPISTNDCATATSNATAGAPDLAITKLSSTPTGGDKIMSATETSATFSLVVTNASLNGAGATGVVIADPLPAAFYNGLGFTAATISSPVTVTVSAGSTATFTCSTANAGLRCTQNGGVLLPGETASVNMVINRPLNGVTATNTATVSNSVEGDSNSGNNSAQDTLTIVPVADLQIAKGVLPASVRAGEAATYTMSFSNTGPSTSAGVTVTDSFNLPAGDSGFTVVSIASTKAGSSCNVAAGAQITPAAPSITCTIGSMIRNEAQSITLVVRPNWMAGEPERTLPNTATIAATTADANSANNSANATLTVRASESDLQINKVDVPDAVVAGAGDPVPFTLGATFLNYRVRITNNGPSHATGVRVTESMVPPAGKTVRFVCDTTATGGSTCNAPALCTGAGSVSAAGTALPTFTCSLPASSAAAQGEMASGESKDLFLRFEVLEQPAATGDVFNNVASVAGNETDLLSTNNSENEQTTTRQKVDLRLTKSASVASVSLRQPFNWIVRVVNNGPGNSLRTDVTDTLPAGTEILGTITWTRTRSAASGTCSASGLTVSCALGQLDSTGEATITIPVRVTSFPAGGNLTNSAIVDNDPAKTGAVDVPGGNNTGSAVVGVVQASLSGTVFQDRDRSGANGGVPQAGASEPRIAGVSLRLTGTDAFGNPVDLSATTDSDGNYSFTGLSPSDASGYTVTETQPAGFVNGPVAPPTSGSAAPSAGGSHAAGGTSGNSSYSGVVLTAGSNATAYNFPELPQASLGGFVYADANNNGVRDSGGDTPIAGATVRLLNAASGAVVATTTTDASGAYNFSALDPSLLYTLEEPLPAGVTNGPVNPGLVNGAACASGCTAQPDQPAAGTDRIASIDLSTGLVGTQFNFGERLATRTSISGLIYLDADRDNALGGSESTRLPGVTVRLVQGADCTSGTTLQTTTSAADGSWRFDDVAVGQNYLVCQTQPAGYGNGNANGTAGSNQISISNLPAAGSSGNSFGETLGALSGSVYQDTGAGTVANFDNGVRNTGESGIAGVPVRLTGTDASGNAVSRSTTTDADGNYRFDNLPPSNATGYTVSEGTIPTSAGSFVDGREAVGSAGGSAALNDAFAGIVLPAGTAASGYHFGELPVATVSGTVYLDRNRDGAMDAAPADGRLPGVTVRLVQGADCASGTTLQTTTTDASGNYSFANLAVGGSYLLCQSQPAGYADGGTNPGTSGSGAAVNAIAISNLPAGGSANNLFGERAASIAGTVYVDSSPATPANTHNGLRDAGESGLAGVPVTLSGRDSGGAVVSRSTVTDADGNYRFDDLPQSDAAGYTVSEGAIPASAGSFNDGRDTAGSAGGSVAVNDVHGAIVLPAGTQATGYNFGELPVAPISGTVYIDRNRNGAADATPTDGRIPGVTLTLYQGSSCSGTPVATTTTDASGNFSFSGASAGLTYTVCQTQPAAYADGGVNPGTGGASGTANAITISNLPAAGSPGNLFGERVGSLAGSVYLDANNDGSRAGSDSGIAGVTVTLSGSDAAGNPVNRSTTTDAAGNWSFGDLLAAGPAGYTVTEQAAQPAVTVAGSSVTTLNGRTSAGSAGGTAAGVANLPSTVSGIALPAGTDATAYHFGEILPVAISGTVFLDVENNGLQNLPADTGIAGVTLQITGTDDTGAAVSRSVVTGADGRYSVADLRPGTYTVTEPTQPPGTRNGLTVPGTAGGTATPAGTAPSALAGIALTTPGASASANNFGEIPANSVISGRVWLDADNSGIAEPAEIGLAGVTITLTGTDSTGQAVSRSTTTDASGNYRFDGLAPGTYTVTEPSQPAGTLDGRVRPGSAGGTATLAGSTPSAISSITLGVAQVSSGNDFGELLASRISGRVWGDGNDNGAIDASESGLSGVPMVLTGIDDMGRAVNLTVNTDAAGVYAFEGLRPGNYTVTEPTQPAGTLNGQTLAGSLGGNATDKATTPSAISAIVLQPGGESVANNFGEIGQSPDLRVRKTHDGSLFTVGKPATWRITVRNVGDAASSGSYTVTDQLPTGLTLAATPTGNGWACVGAAGASQFSCSSSTVLGVNVTGADAITVVTQVGAAAAAASPVNNAVMVDGGGELDVRRPSAAERAAMAGNVAALPLCASVPEHNACRDAVAVQLAASVSGTVWFDIGTGARVLDAGDRRLPAWVVEVVDPVSNQLIASTTTASDGSYKVSDLVPGIEYAIRFRDPVSQVVFGYPVNGETAPGSSGSACATGLPASGTASSCVVAGSAPQLNVVLAAGQELPQQSLPVDPSGVVYDSATRTPVPGSVVTLAPVGSCPGWNPATHIVGATVGGYTINGDAISMTVGDTGLYQFFFGPQAPASCVFGLVVTPPAGYGFPSQALPPAAGPLVPSGAPGTSFPVQPSAAAPTGSDTTYYLEIRTGSGGPDVVNNHIPIDPALPGAMSLSKTGDKAVAEVGDSVRYTITVQVTSGARPTQTTVVDRLPAGFTYIRGTASVDGVSIADPMGGSGGLGPTLAFNLGSIGTSGQAVLRYRVRVGVGAQQGDGINRARAHGCSLASGCVDAGFQPVGGAVATNEGRHAVRVTSGVFATEACVLGKVFVDCNGNHVQDREELGVPGVRLIVSDGTTLISDSEGKYSVCGLPPRSHVIKVDPATLPRGTRLTTSSNRNLGDAGSLWLDLKTGELHRADFIDGSCSNTVLEQVKARRAQGEVRAPETEKKGGPALRFDSKAHGLNPLSSPQQGTDGANQRAPKPRQAAPAPQATPLRTETEDNVPTSQLPMNRPPPDGRDASQAPDATSASKAQPNGASNGTR
ncbi:SdrD B-like domain-containing protein [Aquabacterium sp. OR-4]|uniref:SdrD B-like domain-containing protein n=1 Tax=Aquabacterium sp. OR-4 TaxID=2978127 RepID=UPI0028C65060|nr:SdrD B-like domain-containing protein [Aquabacterium sp. OR-4]MDT7837189.1 SdrD B-like domain-containing protein [Aquabacterium sp. OR-4]